MARWTIIAALIFGLLATPAAARPKCQGSIGRACCCAAAKADLPACCQKKAESERHSTEPGVHGPRCHCRAMPAQPASPAKLARATAAAQADDLALDSSTAPLPGLVANRDLPGILDYGPRNTGPPLRVLLCAWRI